MRGNGGKSPGRDPVGLDGCGAGGFFVSGPPLTVARPAKISSGSTRRGLVVFGADRGGGGGGGIATLGAFPAFGRSNRERNQSISPDGFFNGFPFSSERSGDENVTGAGGTRLGFFGWDSFPSFVSLRRLMSGMDGVMALRSRACRDRWPRRSADRFRRALVSSQAGRPSAPMGRR